MRSLEELEQAEVVGCACEHDLKLWDEAGEIVLDESRPMSERLRAIQVIDRIIGNEKGVTEEDVHNYVAEVQHMEETGD